MYYISEICNTVGFTMEEVMGENISKLTARKEKGTILGSGDTR